jgi:hypothetical protein
MLSSSLITFDHNFAPARLASVPTSCRTLHGGMPQGWKPGDRVTVTTVNRELPLLSARKDRESGRPRRAWPGRDGRAEACWGRAGGMSQRNRSTGGAWQWCLTPCLETGMQPKDSRRGWHQCRPQTSTAAKVGGTDLELFRNALLDFLGPILGEAATPERRGYAAVHSATSSFKSSMPAPRRSSLDRGNAWDARPRLDTKAVARWPPRPMSYRKTTSHGGPPCLFPP